MRSKKSYIHNANNVIMFIIMDDNIIEANLVELFFK